MNQDAILRTIDKADKIGIEGVIELLQKPVSQFGADLDKIRAAWIGEFISSRSADGDTEKTLENMRAWFDRAPIVLRRMQMINVLDRVDLGDGYTKLDELIDMDQNEDETWTSTARPKNIGWALDDLIKVLWP